jgi:catechol 2,3-dioxygenase-like lactoylglutathione lyase family enzyme
MSEIGFIERVDFVTIPTRDIGRAKRFYNEILGLPSKPGSPEEFETANLTLGLWDPEAEGLPFQPATAGIALRVADVTAARRRLERAGVEFDGTEDTGVCHMAFFHDPDGNLLILHRRYAPAGAGGRP